MVRRILFSCAAAMLLSSPPAAAQGLTGTLIGTVKDVQGGVVAGADVAVSSPSLIGGAVTRQTNDKGQLRFTALPPGSYTLEVRVRGFTTRREQGIVIGGGATIERAIVLTPA